MLNLNKKNLLNISRWTSVKKKGIKKKKVTITKIYLKIYFALSKKFITRILSTDIEIFNYVSLNVHLVQYT